MTTAASIIFDLLMRTGSFETDAARAEKTIKRLKAEADKVGKSKPTDFSNVLGARSLDGLAKFGKIGAGLFVLGTAVKDFAILSDAGVKLTGILRNVSDETINYGKSLDDVTRIASGSQADLQSIGIVYARIANSLKDFGSSQEDVSNITEALSLALKVNGATSEETASTLIQLSQAFGKGKLDGDEFRTAMEAAPNAMHQLAKSLGVPFGALKDLGAQGQLTSEVLIKAFTDPAYLASLREQSKQMLTIGGSLTELKNALTLSVISFNDATGAGQAFAGVIRDIASGIQILNDIANGKGIDFSKGIPGGGKSIQVDNETGKAYVGTLKEINAQIDKARKPAAVNYFESLYKGDFSKLGVQAKNGIQGVYDTFQKTTKGLKQTAPEYRKALSDLKQAEKDTFGKVNILPQGALLSDATKQFTGEDKRVKTFISDKSFETSKAKTQRELKELKDAFTSATEGISKESPKYLDALKVYKDKEEEILGRGSKKGGSGRKPKGDKDLEAAQRFLDGLQKQNDTMGLGETATLKYEASQLKLTDTQKALADALINNIDAQTQSNQQIEAGHDLTLKYIDPLQVYINKLDELKKLLDAKVITPEIQQKAAFDALDTFVKTDETLIKINEDQKAFNELVKKQPNEKIKQLGEDLELVNRIFERSGNYKDFIAGSNAAFDKISSKAKKSSDEVSEFFKQAARGIQSSLADFLYDPFAEGLSGMLKGFENTIRRMAAEAAAAEIAKKLFGDLLDGGDGKGSIFDSILSSFQSFLGSVTSSAASASASSGGAGILGSVFGGSGGSIFSGMGSGIASMLGSDGTYAGGGGFFDGILNFFNGYADGGMPPVGKISLVGEKGPELFIPRTAGTVIPNHMLGSAGKSNGGNTTVMFNIQTPDANSFRQSQGQILADAQRTLNRSRRNM